MKVLSVESRFITKEGSEMVAGKTPSPYLRLHDPVMQMLVNHSTAKREQPLRETAYVDRMIHFWREASLAELPRNGRGMDQCYALLFESAFDLAERQTEWALECLDQKPRGQWPWHSLKGLAHQMVDRERNHSGLADAFAVLYAPWREVDEDWKDERCVVASGSGWFWTALLASAGVQEDNTFWGFRSGLSSMSANGWGDNRLHAKLIREAPARAEITPKIDLMDHPIIRMARLKYRDGSVEQLLVNRFLNHRCIIEGFESEENCFTSDVTLAQWVRDARRWATELLDQEPETCSAMFQEAGVSALEAVRHLFRTEISPTPETVDDLDATAALMRWGRRRRGFPYSSYRAQLWEFVVEVVDATLWLGWLFPGRIVRGVS